MKFGEGGSEIGNDNLGEEVAGTGERAKKKRRVEVKPDFKSLN